MAPTRIAIVHYSVGGHVRKMAQASMALVRQSWRKGVSLVWLRRQPASAESTHVSCKSFREAARCCKQPGALGSPLAACARALIFPAPLYQEKLRRDHAQSSLNCVQSGSVHHSQSVLEGINSVEGCEGTVYRVRTHSNITACAVRSS